MKRSELLTKLYEAVSDTKDVLTTGFRSERAVPSFPDEAPAIVDTIVSIASEVGACTLCGLRLTRIKAVPGFGAESPEVLVIGEGPGAEEDVSGLPFVGKSGKYLDSWLDAIGLSRAHNCFIANIVKCRPPENREPSLEEAAACMPYLLRQIHVLKPKVILTLGRIAAQNLLKTTASLSSLRGIVHEFDGYKVVCTYHPSAVLRNPDYRRPVWDDLKFLKSVLGS